MLTLGVTWRARGGTAAKPRAIRYPRDRRARVWRNKYVLRKIKRTSVPHRQRESHLRSQPLLSGRTTPTLTFAMRCVKKKFFTVSQINQVCPGVPGSVTRSSISNRSGGSGIVNKAIPPYEVGSDCARKTK